MNNSQMECRYCHALGHSKNDCPKLKSKKPADITPEPKSMLLARKQNQNIKVVEQKNMFDIDFPSLIGSKIKVKPAAPTMNFLATANNKTEEICTTETIEEKTIIHNGIVLSVL